MSTKIAYASFQNHLAFTLNRADPAAGGKNKFTLPADGWYQIATYGEMVKPLERDGKEPVDIVQVLNRDSAKRIVANFQKEAKQPNFSGVLSDFDHFSFDKEKSTIASGWIENVQDRDDGVWAQIRLSGAGEAALTSGDYRGFSPVLGFLPLEYSAGQRVEPEVILAGALTNKPTFKGMVPLSNRQGDLAQTKNAGVTMDYKAKLLALLKLPSTATDAEIDAAAGTAGDTMNKGAQYDATKNRLETLLAAQIETDLDGLGLKGEARTQAKVALTKNRDEALALFKALGGEGSGYARTHNRDTARSPKDKVDGEEGKATPAEEARAARVLNRANELVASQKIQFPIAFARADAAEPAADAKK